MSNPRRITITVTEDSPFFRFRGQRIPVPVFLEALLSGNAPYELTNDMYDYLRNAPPTCKVVIRSEEDYI